MFDLESKIEALLYWKGESMSLKDIAKSLNSSVEDTEKALGILETKLNGRGLVLMRKDGEVALGTAPEASEVIKNFLKEEMSRDLGRAGLETLSIILYYGPLTRRDIDYIRGVNSAFIVKNLLIRGLVERIQDKKDMRAFLYRPTMELLSFLGLSKVENLPEYEKTKEELKNFKEAVKMEIEGSERVEKTNDDNILKEKNEG